MAIDTAQQPVVLSPRAASYGSSEFLVTGRRVGAFETLCHSG